LRRARSAADAFRRMRRAAHPFISRGDDSGTHKKELDMWRAAGADARGAWRLEVGRGMSGSLQIAEELQAYMLIDRGTWLFAGGRGTLQLLYAGDAALHNPYGVIAVNPARHRVNFAGARAFIDWLVSKRGQSAIGAYAIGGARLFTPAAQ
ncbi:MAG: substrate-binding domain-containing protein, partial [Gammaproteobacteria bacterium]